MRRYILGFFTAAATAAALWLLHRTFPCPLTALLAPANGSPWEMGKLLFWPYLPAALVIWRLGPEGGSRVWPRIHMSLHTADSVSYTHLTLPTICSV